MRRVCDVVLDIETAPEISPEALEAAAEKIKAPSNWKDPEKIAAYIEAEKAKIVVNGALRASTGKVVVVSLGVRGLGDDEQWDFGVFLGDDEKAVLSAAQEALDGVVVHRLATYNGARFDLPFLAARSMRHGLHIQRSLPAPRDYKVHVDLMDVLGGHGGLDEWCLCILGEGKNGSGADVPGLVAAGAWEQVEDYSRRDIELTARLFDRWLGK